jgi:hypothetical protein
MGDKTFLGSMFDFNLYPSFNGAEMLGLSEEDFLKVEDFIEGDLIFTSNDHLYRIYGEVKHILLSVDQHKVLVKPFQHGFVNDVEKAYKNYLEAL